jgi:hypothetical protein
MGTDQARWDEIRATAVSPDRPDNWPASVAAISLNGLALLGVDRKTNALYWDGERLVLEKRFNNVERGLAIIGLIIALVGVAATVVQAYAALAALPVPA